MADAPGAEKEQIMAWNLCYFKACAGRELLHRKLGAPEVQHWQR